MAGRGDRSGAEQTEVFEWEGARKLARDIRYGGSELRSSVRRRMKDVGEIIAVPIRARTPVHQRSPGESPRRDPHPGRLLKGTRVQPHTMSVRIVNNAKSAPTGAYPQGYGHDGAAAHWRAPVLDAPPERHVLERRQPSVLLPPVSRAPRRSDRGARSRAGRHRSRDRASQGRHLMARAKAPAVLEPTPALEPWQAAMLAEQGELVIGGLLVTNQGPSSAAPDPEPTPAEAPAAPASAEGGVQDGV